MSLVQFCHGARFMSTPKNQSGQGVGLGVGLGLGLGLEVGLGLGLDAHGGSLGLEPMAVT